MARLKGLIDFEGTMGGMNAYTVNGNRIIRQSKSSQKGLIKTGENYERTRENNMEFSGAVEAAKIIRQTLISLSRGFVDSIFTGRLQGKYRDIITVSAGIRGQRMFKPLLHADAICAIPFARDLHLDSVLRLKPIITANTERTAATLSMTLNTATDLFIPTGASHVEFIFTTALQPAVEYDAHLKKYKRTDGLDQYHMKTISSILFPVGVDEAIDITLSTPALDLQQLHADSALVSVLGIRFYQQIGFKTYPLETGKVMGFIGID